VLHDKHKEWLSVRGLDPALAEKLGIFTKSEGGANWLVVPFVERGVAVNHMHRLTQNKQHRLETGAPLTLWNHDVLLDDRITSATVIITEGVWDAMAAMRAGYKFVLSVPNGASGEATDGPIDPSNDAQRFRYIWRAQALLDRVPNFIIATDGDGPGRTLAAELVRRLGPERCRFVTYPDGCKDLNDVLNAQGIAGITETLQNAKPYPVQGLYKLSEFPEPPPLTAISIGLPAYDDCYSLVPGTFSVWTGFAGAGKTSLLMFLLGNLLRAGVNVAMGSFETMPKPILLNKLVESLCRSWGGNVPDLHRREAEKLLDERFTVIAQNVEQEDAELTLEQLLELAKIAVIRDGVKLLVIDPWNEIEHKRRPDEGDHDYTGRAIRMIKAFARAYDCAVWVIAHPKKPAEYGAKASAPGLYDVSGSAHWANKADYGVVIHRPDKSVPVVEMTVCKARMGLPGREQGIKLTWRWMTADYAAVDAA
jgi:twinkle protein